MAFSGDYTTGLNQHQLNYIARYKKAKVDIDKLVGILHADGDRYDFQLEHAAKIDIPPFEMLCRILEAGIANWNALNAAAAERQKAAREEARQKWEAERAAKLQVDETALTEGLAEA